MREWGGAHRWGWRDWGFMALNEREGRVGRTEEVSWEADELRMIEHSLRAVQFEGHIFAGDMYLGINCTSSSVKDYAAVWLRAVAAVLWLTPPERG